MTNIIALFLELTILSSIVIAAVLLIKLLFNRKLHTTIISLLWILVLARLLVPFTFNSPVSIDGMFDGNSSENTTVSNSITGQNNIPQYNTGDDAFNAEAYAYNADAVEHQTAIEANNEFTAQNQAVPEAKNTGTSVVNIKKLLSAKGFWIAVITIWAIGAWLTFFSSGYAIFEFGKKISSSKTNDNIIVQNNLKKAKQTIGINKEIEVIECSFIDSPITCGIINPKILLPEGFTDLIIPEKLYMIFLHELSHIKNHDILKNYLWLLSRVIYWFNPLVYIAYNQYQNDIEYICDETVLQYLNNSSTIQYTESLLDAVRISNQKAKIPVALSFCKSKSSLRKRVEYMLKPQKKSKALGMLTIILCAVIVIACFTTACIGSDDINVIEGLDITNDEAESENAAVSLSNEDTNVVEPSPTNESDSASNIAFISLKNNPVGSEEAAIEIAKSINVSNADTFTYQASYEYGVMNIHSVTANSDAYAEYHIYDFNGEIRMLQTSVFLSEELGEELPIEELKQNVIDFAAMIYPNTRLDIIDCVRDTDIYKTFEGEEGQSRYYIVTGTLFDYEDNSTRTLDAHIRLDGGVKFICADYNGMDYLGYSDEVRNMLLKYTDDENAALDLFQIDDYYGDRLLYFTIGNRAGSATLLESDMSLVDFMVPNNDVKAPLDLPEEEILSLVQKYADFYFPENEYVTINDGEILDDGYIGEGTITYSYGTFLFYILLDDDGSMHKIGIEPNIDKPVAPTEKISEETAQENAISELIMECDFVEESKVTIISAEEYIDEYIETYLFNVEYTSDTPSVYDYSFNAQIHIDAYTGDYRRLHIDPNLDELDILTEEEVIALGRQYIEEVYGVDEDALIFNEIYLDAFFVLQYQVNFEYGDKSYFSLIMPDTGENVGTGTGG